MTKVHIPIVVCFSWTGEVHFYIKHGDKDDDNYSMAYLDLLGISLFDIVQETNHDETYLISCTPTNAESSSQLMFVCNNLL